MTIIIFLIILSILVLVHEAGHFFIAKKSGIRVDEFGLGYPPRAKKLFSWKGTEFTLNWLPFGGFVKIFGENYEEQDGQDKMTSKPRYIQVAVLAAGVIANFIFAWALISIGFMSGIPSPVSQGLPAEDAHTVITVVVPGSPAATSGLKSGDKILSLCREADCTDLSPDKAARFIGQSATSLTFRVLRGEETITKVVTPVNGIIEGKPAVGVAMDVVGTVKLAPLKALWEGLKTTWALAVETVRALVSLVGRAFVGHASLNEVTGPVGLVSMVGDVRSLGFVYLLTFTALISINLAVINLFPFPALDGGRMLIVIIEGITRRKIPTKVFNILNTASFALLILLMVIITVRDVAHLL
ncbi:RIP metalloprotease RseP [Candidatus Parcubacteria bacterium]|nr:RIP metalloprotease RseP [Candidatus Parcubacteria bacterium]